MSAQSQQLLRTTLVGDSSVFSAIEEALAFIIACAICGLLLAYTSTLDNTRRQAKLQVKLDHLNQPLQRSNSQSPTNKAASLESDVSRHLRGGEPLRAAEALMGATVPLELGAYKSTLFALARGGDQQQCMTLLDHMRARGVKADAMVYNSVMTAAAKSGSVSACEMLLKTMLSEGCEPNAIIYATLIHACAKASRIAKAEQYYEQMVANGIVGDRILYNTLIHAAARAGDIAKAEHYLVRMAEARVETKNEELRANVVTFTALITAAARTNDLKKALFFLEKMEQEGIASDRIALNAILHLCARLGEEKLGMQLFARMEQGGAATTPDAAAYRSLLRLWSERRNQKKAVETVLTMRRLQFTVDRQSRERACSAFPHLPASTWWD